jgi:hypothetical protein
MPDPRCYYVRVTHVDTTLRDVRMGDEGPPARWGRRVGTVALLVVVVAGALGLFGVRSRTVATTANGYTLSVTYPQVARAGLDVPLRVRIHHAGGFPDMITLAVTSDYFRMFETQGFYPDADSATNDGDFVYLTFTTPEGDDFVIDYDAYIQPASQIGKRATIKLIVAGAVVARTSLHTWLVP